MVVALINIFNYKTNVLICIQNKSHMKFMKTYINERKKSNKFYTIKKIVLNLVKIINMF